MKKSTAVGLGLTGLGLLWWGLASAKTSKAPTPAPRAPEPKAPPTPRAPAPQAPAKPAPVAFKKDPIVLYAQRVLNAQKFGPLAEDGNWGPLTSAAVKKYQSTMAQDVTGTITDDLLDSLAANAPAGIDRPIGPPPPTQAF